MKIYFISYVAMKGGNIHSIGDLTINIDICDSENILNDVREKVKDTFFAGVNVEIAITAFNQI